MEIFNPDGQVTEYLPVSDRIAQFLEKYGPDKGFRVRTNVRDYLDINPGLKAVYAAAARSGTVLSGLPTVNREVFCFEVRLVSPEGKVVAQASALRQIDLTSSFAFQARLWESAETAAFQRLMARVGFGSDTLLADEQRDMAARGTDFKPDAAVSTPDGEQVQAQADAPISAEAEAEAEKTPSSESEEEAAPPEKATVESSKGSEVSEPVLRQIRHLATLRGIEPPDVTTKAQAKAALKELRATPAAQ